MFSIRYDAGERILHLVLEGFWSEQTLAAFAAELGRTIADLRQRGLAYGVLSDSRRFGIQSPQVSTGFERVAAMGGANPRPTAIIVAGMLNKLQVERITRPDAARAFLDEGEARAWLAAELARPAS